MKHLVIVLMTLTVFIRVQGQSKAEIQVAAATTQLTKAMVDADRATLEKLAADQLNYGHSGGHIDDKKEFVEKIASGNSDFLSIDLKDQTIIISGKVRASLVWQKKGGQWELLARQAVKITGLKGPDFYCSGNRSR